MPHSEVWSGLGDTNVTWRWNWLEDNSNSALFAHVNGGSTSGCEFYGNVAWQTGLSGVHASYFIDVASASSSNWKVYNNTFVGWTSGTPGIAFGSGSGNVVQNNIWAHIPTTSGLSIGGSHSYNGYYSVINEYSRLDMASSAAAEESNGQLFNSTPFNDYATGNFALRGPTSAGVTLSSPYNVDMYGNTRGADGVWDRGAFEYLGGGSASVPAAPSSLQVTP